MRSVAYNYQEGGVREITFKAYWRLQQWLWSESVWLVYNLKLADYAHRPALPLTRSQLGFDSLRELNYFKAVAFPESMQARLDGGSRCHGFFLSGQLVNIAWTSAQRLEIEPGVSIQDVGSVGIFDCYTLPEHRSKGVYRDALILLLSAIRDEGATAALIAVDPGNHPSIKGIERAGFMRIYRLTHLRRLGRHILHKSHLPQVGLEHRDQQAQAVAKLRWKDL
jgi:GNAT superfamily N-acetyltransferase